MHYQWIVQVSRLFLVAVACSVASDWAHGQAAPSELNLVLPSGGVTVEEVSWTFEPLCIRPWEVDVLASDLAVDVENLTGVLINGCGGSTSSFEVQFTGDGVSRNFDLMIVDVLSSDPQVLAVIPTSISVPEPAGLVGLAWIPLFVRRRRGVKRGWC